LISWTQPGPEGGSTAGRGRHGRGFFASIDAEKLLAICWAKGRVYLRNLHGAVERGIGG
jgi:hypothetical protein